MSKKAIKHVKPAHIDYHQWDRRALPPNPDGRPKKPEIDLAQLEKLSLLNTALLARKQLSGQQRGANTSSRMHADAI